jgi:transposase
MYTRIQTAKLSNIDPQAWLADVLARIADHSVNRLDELLPWKCKLHAEAAPLSQAA